MKLRNLLLACTLAFVPALVGCSDPKSTVVEQPAETEEEMDNYDAEMDSEPVGDQ